MNMETRKKYRLSRSVIHAFKDTVPVAMGYLPLGMGYGILLVNADFDWYWAPITSLLVFAGALQYASVGFLSVGMPLWEIALTCVIINFRHVFYGISYPVEKLKNSFVKLYGMFALTDETYSLLANKDRSSLDEVRIFFIQLFSHVYWISGCTLGALTSVAFPVKIGGVEFAMTALFVVLAQEHVYVKGKAPYLAAGFFSALMACMLSSEQFLAISMTLFLILLLSGYYVEKR